MTFAHRFMAGARRASARVRRPHRMPQLSVPTEAVLKRAIDLIGQDGLSDDDIQQRIAVLVDEPVLAQRLIAWLPEAFGLVLISGMDGVDPPAAFTARDRRGRWREFAFDAEPLLPMALVLANEMFIAGPRYSFGRIAQRSAMVAAVSQVLQQDGNLLGARISGPAIAGVPAEVYSAGAGA
ncbi:MAG: hypothetical protein HOQ32_13715 [Lysobacter sp.]|nr:hypothetical protein [Lysobacter sp.]